MPGVAGPSGGTAAEELRGPSDVAASADEGPAASADDVAASAERRPGPRRAGRAGRIPAQAGAPEQERLAPLEPPAAARRAVASRAPLFLLGADLLALASTLLVLREPDLGGVLVFAAAAGVWALTGLYRRRLSLSVLDDAPLLLTGLAVGAAVVLLPQAVTGAVDVSTARRTLVLAVTVLLGRTLAYAVVHRRRSHRELGPRTLVLGAGIVGCRLARTVVQHREYGLRLVGMLDSRPLVDDLPAPLLGGHLDLAAVVEQRGVDVVLVAFGTMPESELVEVLRTCDRLDCEILVVPRLFEMHHVRSRETDELWGVPLVWLRRAAQRGLARHVKRALDVVASGAALVLLSPVMAAVAVAVRLEGGPGVLFRQVRVGLDGQDIEVLKFRSMRPVDEHESATKWSVADDDRVGRVGRFIRATSLDELPQLFNVLRGDMSLVGPRPERPYYASLFAERYPRYDDRHRVAAGLTGLAAVRGLRGDTSIEERQTFDNLYIENWSLYLDVKILLRTVGAVLRRTGG